jgi:hypothetical protein
MEVRNLHSCQRPCSVAEPRHACGVVSRWRCRYFRCFARPPGTTVAARRLRVLVADDNHDAADSLLLLIRPMDHEARVVYDGRSALILAQSFRPDVVLPDIGKPHMNGY